MRGQAGSTALASAAHTSATLFSALASFSSGLATAARASATLTSAASKSADLPAGGGFFLPFLHLLVAAAPTPASAGSEPPSASVASPTGSSVLSALAWRGLRPSCTLPSLLLLENCAKAWKAASSCKR